MEAGLLEFGVDYIIRMDKYIAEMRDLGGEMRNLLFESIEISNVLSGTGEYRHSRFKEFVLKKHANGSFIISRTSFPFLSVRLCFFIGCNLEPLFGKCYCVGHCDHFNDHVLNRMIDKGSVLCTIQAGSEESGTISVYSSVPSSSSAELDISSDESDTQNKPPMDYKLFSKSNVGSLANKRGRLSRNRVAPLGGFRAFSKSLNTLRQSQDKGKTGIRMEKRGSSSD